MEKVIRGIKIVAPAILWSLAFLIFVATYWGWIDFGGNAMNQRIILFIGLAVFSLSHLFAGGEKIGMNTRLKIALGSFIFGVAVFFVWGGNVAVNDAIASQSTINYNNFWVAFDINTDATAELTIGLNAKLIADTVCTIVPAVTFMVLIFQMIYAGESDEFIKAFLEGIAVVIFMLVYHLVGGAPL
jgi:hypothetical protein